MIVLNLAKPHTHSSIINILITEVVSPINLVVTWGSPRPISVSDSCNYFFFFSFVVNKLMMMMMMMIIRVFPRLALVTCFSTLGAGYVFFFRAWRWLHVFPRLALVTSFSAGSKTHTFSRPLH